MRRALPEHFRRIDPRYERQLEVEMLFDGKKQVTRTRNLSLGGLYVETPFPIPIGTTVQLRFQLPTQPEPVEVNEVRVDPASRRAWLRRALLIWCRPACWKGGWRPKGRRDGTAWAASR